ncbi:MAG: VWA domain-containing protein [Bacteroidetes bacterium]|nr:MAG: VWA domain-containing protein [Bacteroidota bacterium]
MFISFFLDLRRNGIRCSLQEYLDLLQSLRSGLGGPDLDDLYAISRSLLVKREEQFDAFDRVFGQYFRGKESPQNEPLTEIPEEWLREELTRVLSPEELAEWEASGGMEALIEQLRQGNSSDQEGEGYGPGNTRPEGSDGTYEDGERRGGKSKDRNARKVWETRQYANLDENAELNTRNLKMALRRLRILTREGRGEELDLGQTIRRTSENAGMLDIRMQAPRRNHVKVLLLLDIGGSMDDHIELCSRLFSAAKHEFKHLEFYYFHNCVYEYVWRDNRRRFSERIPTWQLLNTYNRDYKVIWVGDAAMSPVEILYPGGSVEHHNPESGQVWLQRFLEHYPSNVWLNPSPDYGWNYFPSTGLIRKMFDLRMFPLTPAGIRLAMKSLKDRRIHYGDEDSARTFR